MEHLLAFLFGFMIAGLIGWASSLLLRSWLPNITSEQPAEGLMKEGCSQVVTLVILPLSLLVIVSLFLFSFQHEWLLYFLLGLFFAILIGFHLQNIYLAWLRVFNLKRILLQKIRSGFRYEELHGQQQSRAKLKEEYSLRKQTTKYQTPDPGTSDITQKHSSSRKLIKEHRRRLQKLKEQEARMGINTPPEVLNEIEDIEEKIKKLEDELAKLETGET